MAHFLFCSLSPHELLSLIGTNDHQGYQNLDVYRGICNDLRAYTEEYSDQSVKKQVCNVNYLCRDSIQRNCEVTQRKQNDFV